MARPSIPSILMVAMVAGCSGNRENASRSDNVSPDRSAIVVKGSELSGNLLEGLRNRVPFMQVGHRGADDCPRIMFRGVRSIRNQANPTVYVDGTRMLDTCILLQTSSSDIDYVEIYPSGSTTRTSYEQNPFGLILIFRKRE